ncbi:MAG: HD domain-containing protein [Oscillospiraceae bacterium]|nr:HD domain-containing protein [Oscillospiraceae bacterium]
MKLPENVLVCIRTLENAGHQCYAVGGCVRDSLLGRTPTDYDLCTDALPEETVALFSDHTLVRAGEKHGTIGVVMDGQVYEITTFRTEGGYTDSRHPGWVRFVPDLREDLKRRDFTVNAMAYSPTQGYIDPFGGAQDLQNGVLRTVGDPTDRFTEDALRILRGVRFSVRFGLEPEFATEKSMQQLCPLLDSLARERVFDELCKLILSINARQILRFAPVLCRAIPQLAPCRDFCQHSPHHAYDVLTHTAYVVENTAPVLPLRWAALLHDIGKPQVFTQDENSRGHFYGHAAAGAQMASEILQTLRAPTALREKVVFLIQHHMTPFSPDKKLLRRRLGKYGVENCRLLLQLQKADDRAKGVPGDNDPEFFSLMEELLEQVLREDACLTVRDLDVDGKDLIAIGFAPGKQLGQMLERLLELVQQEELPNEKAALLAAAKEEL